MSPESAQNFLRRIYPDLDQRPSKPKNGASFGLQVVEGDHVVVEAIWGGAITDGLVNFICSGRDAPEFAQACQQRFPGKCRITRADVATDFDETFAWDTLYQWGLLLADKHALKVTHQGDFHRGQLGRSIYIGSQQSACQLVIYEKGKQLPEFMRPNWVRVELRVRPKGVDAGRRVGDMPPHHLYGCSKWSMEVLDFIGGEGASINRVKIGTRYVRTDEGRAVNAFLTQYGNVLAQLAINLGGWPELGQELGKRLLEVEKQRADLFARLQRSAPNTRRSKLLKQVQDLEATGCPF